MFYVHQNCLLINHTNSYAFSQHFLRILPQFLDVFPDFPENFRPLKHVEIDIPTNSGNLGTPQFFWEKP